MSSSTSRVVRIIASTLVVIVIGSALLVRFGASSIATTVSRSTRNADSSSGSDSTDTVDHGHADEDQLADASGRSDSLSTLLGIGFEVAHTATRIGNDALDGVVGLSVDEEMKIGREAWNETTSRHTVVSDSQQQARVERLATPFLKVRSRKNVEYRFTIIDDDAVNAFAHLGGFVYVNHGLLNSVQNDDELSFVIGHEIAHVDRRHCVKNMTAIVRAQQAVGGIGGSLASIAYQAISVGYSEDFELDADQWSYRVMRRLGRSHDESLQGLRMLEREFGADGDHHAHGPAIIRHVEDHFRTHPRIDARIAQLGRLRNDH